MISERQRKQRSEQNLYLNMPFSRAFDTPLWADHESSIRTRLATTERSSEEVDKLTESSSTALLIDERGTDPEVILMNYEDSILIDAGISRETLNEPRYPNLVLIAFLCDLGFTRYVDVASLLGLPAKTIFRVLSGELRISVGLSQRLSECFGTPERFWSNLQHDYDQTGRYSREVCTFPG
jgi:plasmid maintenance system antidote protein VapI